MQFIRRRFLTTNTAANTNTPNKEKLPTVFRRYSSFVSIFFYLCGIFYIFGVAWPAFVHYTYISENALSPGVVDERFDADRSINEKLDGLKAFLKSRGGKKDVIPSDWLYREFLDARLEAYVQNFTVRYPSDVFPSSSGRNVFGVVRAPRGSSTEAVVIAVPYGPRRLPAIAVMLALAKFCRNQIYWAKDLFFVVTDQGEVGMQAWLNSYHGINSEYIKSAPISCQGGPIQAAVCLELGDTTAGGGKRSAGGSEDNNEILYNMINGQLPNLDLVNVAVRLSEKHNYWPTIFDEREWHGEVWEKYGKHLSVAVRGLARQAIGPTPGLHSVFGSFNVEAVTLRPKIGGGSGAAGVARMLEGMLRSINNLLERFHQSFFFYMLLSPHRYVSIGVYMPAVGLMLLAPLIKASALWISMDKGEAESGTEKNKKRQLNAPAAAAAYFLVSHCIGLLIRLIPDYAQSIRSMIGISAVDISDDQCLLALMITIAVSTTLPIAMLMKRFRAPDAEKKAYLVDLYRCVCLLELGLALGVISVLNFGLGFMLCLVWAPVFSLLTPSSRWIFHIFKLLLAILMNPFVLLFFANYLPMMMIMEESKIDQRSENAAIVALMATKERVISMIAGTYLHSDWLFTVITVVLYPIWVQLMILIHIRD